MTHSEKERFALSAVVAVVLYVAFFLTTGWLDILKPNPAASYVGPMIVEVALVPLPAIRQLVPPEPEVAEQPAEAEQPPPVEQQREPTPTPIAEPDPTPVQADVPEPREISLTQIEQPLEVSDSATPSEALVPRAVPLETRVEAATETVPVLAPEFGNTEAGRARANEAATGSGGPPATAPPAADSQVSSGTGETEAAARARAPERVFEAGEDSSVSRPALDLASTEAFRAAREDTPTGQAGENKIIYGPEDAPNTEAAEAASVSSEAREGSGPILGEQIAQLDKALQSAETRENGGDGSPAGSPTTAGGPTGGATGTPGGVKEEIEADSVEALDAARTLMSQVKPVLRPGALGEGQRRLGVMVRFTILATGIVKDVELDPSSGITEVDEAIRKALRQWKFAPVTQGSPEVPVRLLYTIEATD